MNQLPNKVCPVVLRRSGEIVELLAFEHPLAGRQLVKGTIEAGEDIEAAALRELAEESGIVDALVSRVMGIWPSGFEQQVWAFVACVPGSPLPDSWAHDAPDDGGRTFRFFWHPLDQPADPEGWHLVFREAMRFIRDATTNAGHRHPWSNSSSHPSNASPATPLRCSAAGRPTTNAVGPQRSMSSSRSKRIRRPLSRHSMTRKGRAHR
jgi:8-oxo-dGTP pyrophosphatase MutT (NUDIX family)